MSYANGSTHKNDTKEEENAEADQVLSSNMEDARMSFREQWLKELESLQENSQSKLEHPESAENKEPNDDALVEVVAKNLFLKGIEYEQSRQFYEAVQFYKRAVQLVPDIEFRLYESMKLKTKDADDITEEINNEKTANIDNEDYNAHDGEETDLFVKLCRIVNHDQRVCVPKFEQNTTHISALPMEIVLYILRWVVSSELDLRSLEMFSRVCRGFYISARDTEIWRLACVRVWGVNCGTYTPKYQSWREMYLQRPRLRYNGCYICKISYIRSGENSFSDRFYRPWHLVEYFRYLRFFPEGRVLMLTSTDDAQSCVNALKYRTPRNASVRIGHYRLHDNCVTLVLKKQESKTSMPYKRKKREPIHDSGEQTYHIEFEIQDYHKRMNSQLKWLTYVIFTRYRNGQEGKIILKEPSMREWQVLPMDIRGGYPHFKFSRVKSYTQESEAPLQ